MGFGLTTCTFIKAKDMKQKLGFLRRRHTDTALHAGSLSEKSERSVRPAPEVARTWAQTLDNLLQDKYGLALFRAFLKSEFSEENLEFWMACEEYKKMKANKMTSRARKIFSDYVAIQAPKEINLDSITREKTVNNLTSPDKASFDAAQKRVQGLMEKDSYPRFLQSSLYLELVRDNGAR